MSATHSIEEVEKPKEERQARSFEIESRVDIALQFVNHFVYRLLAMDLIAAQKLARELMQRHGLPSWKFDFDRAARRFGSCSVGRKTITLSWKLTMLNSEPQVRNTLLHEIAHALTPGDGHGPKWKSACIQLGIKPDRCFTDKEVAIPARRASRYEIGCEKCAWWHPRHRLSDRPMICKTCRSAVLYRERMSGRRFRIGRGAKIQWLDSHQPQSTI